MHAPFNLQSAVTDSQFVFMLTVGYILLAVLFNTHKVFGNCLLDLSQCGRESCNPDGKVPFL